MIFSLKVVQYNSPEKELSEIEDRIEHLKNNEEIILNAINKVKKEK